MKLLCENFEEYYCEKKTNIGLNMNNLFKLITLVLYHMHKACQTKINEIMADLIDNN